VPKHWRIPAALNGIVGGLVTVMMSVHIAAVLITHAPQGWHFRFYGLLLFGAVGAAAGMVCVRAAVRMFSGDAAAIASGLRGSLIMIALYAPVIPLQRIALAITLLALLNAALLLNCQRQSSPRRQHTAGAR
jgi:hypothetical protein